MPEKPSVRLVDAAGLIDPLVGGLSIPVDGTSVLAGDEVLLPEPPNGSAYAGPWVAAAGPWARRSDWDSVTEMVAGDWWYVREGSQFAGTTWQFENTSQPATLNVTPLTIGWRTRRRVVEPGGAFQIQGTTPPILTEVAISDVQSTFIEGLGVEYVSANALRVKAGACYVPGISGVVDVDADVDLTSLTLTASTWYYCYVYSAGGGVGGVELSPQRPASPYRGNARAKGGGVGGVLNNTDPDIEPDFTRRYIPRSAIYASATNTIRRFEWVGDLCRWTGAQSSLRAVNKTSALNTSEEVSITPFCPPHGEGALVAGRARNDTNNAVYYIASADDGHITPPSAASAGQLETPIILPSAAQVQTVWGPVVLGGTIALRHGQSLGGSVGYSIIDVLGFYEEV